MLGVCPLPDGGRMDKETIAHMARSCGFAKLGVCGVSEF